jgi:hypothetical protein
VSPVISTRGGVSAGAYGWGAASAVSTAFESIASASGTGSSGTITFSSIPSTFKHLQLRIMVLATSGDCGIRVNGDSGTNYARHVIRGDGSSVSSFGQTSYDFAANLFPGGISATLPSVAIIDILDYASTTKNKTFRILSGQDYNSSGYLEPCSALWLNTAAITSISVINSANNWNTSTRTALYGIKESA